MTDEGSEYPPKGWGVYTGTWGTSPSPEPIDVPSVCHGHDASGCDELCRIAALESHLRHLRSANREAAKAGEDLIAERNAAEVEVRRLLDEVEDLNETIQSEIGQRKALESRAQFAEARLAAEIESHDQDLRVFKALAAIDSWAWRKRRRANSLRVAALQWLAKRLADKAVRMGGGS